MTYTATKNNCTALPEFMDAASQTADSLDPFDSAMSMLTSLAGEATRWYTSVPKPMFFSIDTPDKSHTFSALFDFFVVWTMRTGFIVPAGIPRSDEKFHQPLFLLTSSADRSVLTWSPYEGHGTWVTEARLAIFSSDGQYILAQNYLGALQTWQLVSAANMATVFEFSGHAAPIKGLSWEPTGSFIASTSLDQTTRLYSTWKRNGKVSWHELSRPQIHGYDLNCITFFKKFAFVSGADEKVLRVFEAPKVFTSVYKNLSAPESISDSDDLKITVASLPALGLSNKAVSHLGGLVEVRIDSPLSSSSDATFVVPETNKLYGHAFELICASANNAGTIIASASKATKPEYAAIRLWSTANWKEICTPLLSHSLTVTDLKFSPNDEYLMWTLFKRKENEQGFEVAASNSSHARIVKIWKLADILKGGKTACCTLTFDVGAVSIDFCRIEGTRDALAVGLENGVMQIFNSKREGETDVWVALTQIPEIYSHVAPVNIVSWRPSSEDTKDEKRVLLASGSEDFSLRLFSFPSKLYLK
ncbi:WD40-repeat-containing domain protein [Chytridium lagenaria]|nr:WD40-repeat-containing domain protein [Chytridium lagenaria]